MNKREIIEDLKALIRSGELTKNDLLDIYADIAGEDSKEINVKQSRISNILYYIGGAIVFLGICIFVGTNWATLNNITKILITLGSAVAMHMTGVLLSQYKQFNKVSDAFFFLSALVAPLGIFITMDINGIDVSTAGIHSVISAILLSVYVSSFILDKRNVFIVFMVIFGTWAFFSLTTFLLQGQPFTDWNFIKYRWLVAGFSYIALGYSFAHTQRKPLSSWLYGFGVIAFLTAAMCLGGYSPNQNVFWELVFPGLAFGVIFLSVYLKVRSFLVFGTMYLMIYILKITGEYFTSGFGWALSLIFVGFALIALGYFAFYLNNKYMKRD